MENPFAMTELENGLKVVVEHMPGVRTAAAGFLARTGSRDEQRELAGVSHFLEHMCFKGTPNRNATQLSLDFDNLGAHPNAFTSQDRTFYHAFSRAEDLGKQIEILADMMSSTLPQNEFDTERLTVLNEIAMSKDQLEHVALDAILEEVFRGHPLGWPVLGYDDTVGGMSREQMEDYFRIHYAPDNMVLVVTGAVKAEEVFELARKYCGHWKPSGYRPQRQAPIIQTGRACRTNERFRQQLVAVCFAAPSAIDPLHDTAEAAADILGGSNSRVFWNVVQEGISSQAAAFRFDYQDCALFILYGVAQPEKCEALVDALRKEAKKMASEPVEDRELQRVRNKLRTTLAVEGEATHYRLRQVMDDVDYRGRPRTLEDRIAAVEAVSADSILECFRRYPVDGEGFLVSVGPRAWPNGG